MKKYYIVQMKRFNDSVYHNQISASHVSLEYAKGFCDGIRQFYPCPDTRVIESKTGEIIEENKGNSPVACCNNYEEEQI